MKLVIPSCLLHERKSFSDIGRKGILPNMTEAIRALNILGKVHCPLIFQNFFFLMKLDVTE